MKKKDIVLMVISVILIVATYIVLCTYKNFIEIKDGSKNLALVKGLITYVVDNNNDMISEADYIAIDINSFNITNESDKNKLVNYIRNYNQNIVIGPIRVLDDPQFKNKDGSLKGIFISASDLKFSLNKLKGSYSVYKSPVNAIGYDIVATYSSNEWKIEYKAFIS